MYFLAYPGLSADEIRHNIKFYAEPTDWIAEVDGDYLTVVAQRCFQVNEKLVRQCKDYGYELFDIGAGDERTKALNRLLGKIMVNRELKERDNKMVNIRKAEIMDIPKIFELQTRWYNENITYGYVSDNEQSLIRKVGHYFLVAEMDNEIIGFACGSIHEAFEMAVIEDGEQYLEIDDVYIMMEYRNSGVGTILVDRLIETAIHTGYLDFM